MRETLQSMGKKLQEFVRHYHKLTLAVLAVFLLAGTVLTVAASGVRFAYKVQYQDEVIALVGKTADYKKADEMVSARLKSGTASKIQQPRFGFSLTTADQINSTEEVAQAIINNNEDIIKVNTLLVNGQEKLYTLSGDLREMLDKALAKYDIPGADNSSAFIDDVKIGSAFHLRSALSDADEMAWVISSLNVKTTASTVTQIEIPFETVNEKTASQPSGYSTVKSEGENGLSEKTEQTVYLNGVKQSTVLASEKVIKEPVDKVVLVGTAVYRIKSKSGNTDGFICPLLSGKYTVSAYFGDGRNHKGVDLAANAGTPIFAAGGGKVISAGFDGDFGYNVIMEHGSGIRTRYAHCSALCVSAGQTLAQGDMIGTVGKTGWATGNHLHFEISINGTRVDPAPYIGLY